MPKTAKEKLIAEIDDLIEKAMSDGVEEKIEESETSEDTKKSLDEVSDAKAKGTDVSLDANGGGDVIKNKDAKDAGVEKVAKTKDADEDEDEEDGEDMEKKKMKKSFEVSAEDYEMLQKAKSEAAEKAAAEAAANDPLVKSISSLTDLIKGQSDTIKKLSDEVESLKKSPAREPKSLAGYKPLEKGGEAGKQGPKLMKSQVLDVLFELQKADKVKDVHVCEYESTGNIQDRMVKSLLESELNKVYGKTN